MGIVESFSGIRGIFGKDLTEDIAVRYAYSYISFIRHKTKKKNPTIVIGRDTRPSGQRILEAIIGMMDCSFINAGIASTPCIEHSVRHFEADGGIIITASHNEPFWNGFKFLGSDGAVLGKDDMQLVIDGKTRLKDFHKIQERKVLDKNKEAIEEYSKFIVEIVGRSSISKIRNNKQKILIDPNGGAGIIAKHVLEKIGADFEAVNMNYGEFSRKVEPTEDSLIYLAARLKETNSEFAAGFDCDADRVEILLPNGRLVSGNEILALIVDYYLLKNKHKRCTVVVNDATSGIVHEAAKKYGAKVIEVEVGETNVVSEIGKRKALIGGEGSSGGVIIPPSKCRDGILTLALVLLICAEKEKKLSELIDGLPKYYTLKAKIEFDPKKHGSIKKSLKSYFSKKKMKIAENGGIKGSLKVYTGKNSFVWFRASKTEGSVFRIIADSRSEAESRILLEDAVKAFEDASG